MILSSLIFNHCEKLAAGEPILPTILHMQKKKYEEHFFIGLALNMHRDREDRAKREKES